MFDFESKQLPGGNVVVRVTGTLDEANRAYFFDCVGDLINDGFTNVIVDCDGLGSINSSGLAGLVHARDKAQAKGGKIYLTHVNATIVDVLSITRLNTLFAIYPTTDELVKSLVPGDDTKLAPEG